MRSSWKHCTGVVKLQRVTDERREQARRMRRNMTEAESALWAMVRDRRLGVKFRRQQVIDGFIADFYCEELRLAVEADGGWHARPAQRVRDAHREGAFLLRGIRTIRFANGEVLANAAHIRETLVRLVVEKQQRVTTAQGAST
jgi:leucyl-tRNA synthetase